MTSRDALVRRGRWLAWAAGWALLAVGPAPAGEIGRLRGLARPFRGAPDQGRQPLAPCSGAVERLGDEVTWLERHLDLHGSIVAKQPDVWGQGRLTRSRAEYEEQMRRQLGQFSARTSAALRRSDQSFLGMALALQAAAGNRPGSRAVPLPPPASSSVVNQIQGWLPTTNEPVGRSDPVVIARSEPFAGPVAAPGLRFDEDAIALEPTLHLDQLSRYLDHLAQLRRVNEGDDSADAPGYALTLVRIPVSILPGERTCRGHGAEITVSIEPCLGDDLLPVTFRNLVINDVVDIVAPVLTWCINDPDCVAWAETIARGAAADAPEPARQGVRDAARALAARLPAIAPASAPALKTRRARLPLPSSQLADVAGIEQVAILVRDARAALAAHPIADPCIDDLDVRGFLTEELEAAYDLLALEAQRPVWGELPAWNLAALVRGRQTRQVAALRCRFLAGLGADAEAEEPGLVLPPAAATAVGPCCDREQPLVPVCRTTTAVLAWGILVESALLDERLAADVREAASARGLPVPAAAQAGPFYGPDPSPQARQGFNDYVRCRWPIRVFALDPVVEEQNVDDSYARRRELQIAMAVATASGRIGAQALTRFTRRQELDLATVALNRTAVGFSHGDDTFGWRFYPRVQTPPDRGALGALAETVCPPGDLAQRRLEPGQRECAAIVVMPSFVPWMTLDVRANWFALAHPGTTEQTMKQALLLSRSLQAVRANAAACQAGSDRYTGAAVRGLLRRIDQLERRLPLQTLQAQVPHENTAGGFELFNAGTSDLAPELVGWYGAPGIDPAAGTTLFLVGKGFSVHDTQVIAGGRPAPFRLLSREVIRVDVPAGVLTIAPPCAAAGHARRGGPGVVPVAATEPLPAPHEPAPAAGPALPAPDGCGMVDCGRREVVDIHLATPYGVSGHLLVPVARRRDPVALDGPVLQPATALGLTFAVVKLAGARTVAARIDEFFTTDRDEIAIAMPASFIPPPRAELRLVLRDEASGATAAVFSFPDPFFDARGGRYVIAGGSLRNFVGDTSRPATDKTLRGALKPWLDEQLARGALAEDGDAATCALTATIVAAQQELPVSGSIVVHVQRRGRTVTEPRPAAEAAAAPDAAP